jgi:tRNA1Val (adenine37-N6)-methyltransferase
MTSATTDTFFGGRIRVCQPADGYRFSIDAVILAHHAIPRPQETVLDLGTGCGIIAVLMALRHPTVHFHAVEVQPLLAELARANVAANDLQERIDVHCLDMRSLYSSAWRAPVDMAVSNPPFHRADSGRLNPDGIRAAARHELTITLEGLIAAAQRMLRTGGRFVLIYTAERAVELLRCLSAAGLEPKRIRMIHAGVGSEAKRILVEAVRAGRPGVKILPPLLEYTEDGTYSEEVAAMLRP